MAWLLSTYEKEQIIRMLSHKDAHIVRTKGGGAIMTYTLICPDEDICARELADYEWDEISWLVYMQTGSVSVGTAELDTLEYRLSPEHKVKDPMGRMERNERFGWK